MHARADAETPADMAAPWPDEIFAELRPLRAPLTALLPPPLPAIPRPAPANPTPAVRTP